MVSKYCFHLFLHMNFFFLLWFVFAADSLIYCLFSLICPYPLVQKVLIKSWSIPQENFLGFNLIKHTEAKTIHNNNLHLCCSVTVHITLYVWSIQCLGTDCLLTVFVIDCDFCVLINLSFFLLHDYQLYYLAVSIKNTILLRVLSRSL